MPIGTLGGPASGLGGGIALGGAGPDGYGCTTLITSIGARTQQPTCEVYLGGRLIAPHERTKGLVTLGFRPLVASSAAITLGQVPEWLAAELATDPRWLWDQPLEVRAGYGSITVPIFTGLVKEDAPRFWPFSQELTAYGQLHQAQRAYKDKLTYDRQTDVAIVTDLLTRAGCTQLDIQGEGYTLATRRTLVKDAGQPLWTLINQLDELFGYATWDMPDGTIRRRRISGIPSSVGAWAIAQGATLLDTTVRRNVLTVRPAVVVIGLPTVDGDPITATATGSSAYAGATTQPEELRLDLVETTALASIVAARRLAEVNRPEERVEPLKIALNPLLVPGQTVTVSAAAVRIPANTPYLVQEVKHTLDLPATSHIGVVGGAPATGYETPPPPEAAFTWRLFALAYDPGSGTPETRYLVTCDGSPSWDPAASPAGLAYVWTNSAGADESAQGSGYTASFTSAQLSATPAITLTVSNALGDSGSLTQTIDQTAVPLLGRQLYLAEGTQMAASQNGGASWASYTPPDASTVISTPEIAGVDADGFSHSYFGTSSGRLYRTRDFLTTAPLLITTFPAAVNTIWVNERTNDRVLVGLANGTLWQTTNASAGASATWTQLTTTFASPILWAVESGERDGLMRVAAGASVFRSYDSFATSTTVHTFTGGTARQGSLSPFGNFFSATAASGGNALVSEDGTALTFPASVEDVRGLTHHLRHDTLWAISSDGRTFVKTCGASTMEESGILTDAGTVRMAVRDGDDQRVLYVAASNGLYVSTDGSESWARMRSGDARQVGYGNLSAV